MLDEADVGEASEGVGPDPVEPPPVRGEFEDSQPVPTKVPASDVAEPEVAEPEPVVPSRPKPSRAASKEGRKPPAQAKTPAHESEECRSKVAAALSAEADGSWIRLEILTRSRKCFGDRTQWAKLRTHALLETGRFAECSALADKFEDPFVQKYAHTCRAQQDRQ